MYIRINNGNMLKKDTSKGRHNTYVIRFFDHIISIYRYIGISILRRTYLTFIRIYRELPYNAYFFKYTYNIMYII